MDALALRAARVEVVRAWLPRLAVGAGTLAVIAVTVFLLDRNFHHAVSFALLVMALMLALARPKALLIGVLVQLPLIPRWGTFLGIRVPDLLTPLLSLSLVGIALWWLADRRREPLRFRVFDLLVLAFLLMGQLNLHAGGFAVDLPKWQFRGIIVPGLAYFAIRLLMLNGRGAKGLLVWQLGAGMALSTILLLEALLHRSFLYQSMGGHFYMGVYQPAGPFQTPYFAAAYLTVLLPLYLYGVDGGFGLQRRRVFTVGMALAIAAVGVSLERGAWLSVLAALAVCAMHPTLRGKAGAALGIGVLLFALGFLASGHIWIETRLTETDNVEDRQRFLHAAGRILGSPEWNPLRGIGYGGYVATAYLYMPPRSYYDDTREPEADRGRALHNDYLTTLVEQGLLGAGVLLGLLVAIGARTRAALRERVGPRFRNDRRLVVALLASIVALLVGSLTHNCFGDSTVMLPLWVSCAVLFSDRALAAEPAVGVV